DYVSGQKGKHKRTPTGRFDSISYCQICHRTQESKPFFRYPERKNIYPKRETLWLKDLSVNKHEYKKTKAKLSLGFCSTGDAPILCITKIRILHAFAKYFYIILAIIYFSNQPIIDEE